jgi:hypothetical protein
MLDMLFQIVSNKLQPHIKVKECNILLMIIILFSKKALLAMYRSLRLN